MSANISMSMGSPELDVSLPSVRYIQNLIKDRKPVEITLLTNDKLTGRVIWQDVAFLCMADESEQRTLVNREAIVCIKPQV